MKLQAYPILITFLLVSGMACEQPAGTDGPNPQPRQGVVSGQATDSQGKPLAGAKIVVNNTQFYNSNILGQTDTQGRYQLNVTPGSWYVRGTTKVKFDGKEYVLDLDPDTDVAFAGTEGTQRNLRLKLAGRRTGEFGNDGYYGGQVEVFSGDWSINTEDVALTLEPVGTLIDGSTGQTISRTPARMFIDDVPLGKYKLTARYVPENKPLKIRIRNQNQDYLSSVTASFDPSYPGATGSYKLNVEVTL
ncbi:hypothetical protein GCM10027341_07040 [Spirosoma knui]